MDTNHADRDHALRAKGAITGAIEGEGVVEQEGSSLTEATFAIIKSAVGPAMLYMPNGMKEGGIAFSVPMMCLSWSLFSW